MNLGAPEMLLLGILALILFGPRRLPELGKALGEGLAAFRESSRQLSSEFKRQLEEETAVPRTPAAIPAEATLGTPIQAAAPLAAVKAAEEEAAPATAEPEGDLAQAPVEEVGADRTVRSVL